ncbi:unnamed protein product [Schistocephalus solidus]|uniref:Uncharacterized protein n=1 Tax=Schistocephalus solidus TaxID=70667 RepID=A0A183TLJ8_SCHSO|nr:unnamed protein product [Schistocephalus solidus]
MLVDLSRDRVRARCFPTGELLHGSDGFLERGRETNVGVGFRFRQAIFGGVGDDGVLVSSVLPSQVRRGMAPLNRGSENSLGGEKVFSFVLVCVSLDFLGFARHPGILHLPQSLQHKAATSVEGCLVCSGMAIDIGCVQMVLIDEQIFDGCVVVTEPVLVLTTCAAMDIQGGGLDGVPQLAPAVIYGVIRVGNWKVG